MTAGELFTVALSHKLNIGGGDALIPVKRERARFHGQALILKAENAYPWPWRMSSGTMTLSAGDGYGLLPADFAGTGRRFRVFLHGTTRDLRYLPADKLMELRTMSPSSGTEPRYYTFQGQNASGRKKLHVYPTNSGALTLDVSNYNVKSPRLIDRPDKPTTAAGAAGLLNGTYRYRLTAVHPDGETEGGEISASLAVVLKHVTVTMPTRLPDSTVTSFNLYRTTGSGSAFLLVGSVGLTALTYDDNVADGSLGVACPTPTTAQTGLERIPSEWHEGVFFDGLCARLERDQGDSRSVQKDAAFLAGLRDMWINERPGLNTGRRLPRYGASA